MAKSTTVPRAKVTPAPMNPALTAETLEGVEVVGVEIREFCNARAALQPRRVG